MKIIITRKHFNHNAQWLLAVLNAVRNEPLPPSAMADLDIEIASLQQLSWDEQCRTLAKGAGRELTIGWNETELLLNLNDDYIADVLNCIQPELLGKVIGLTLNLIGHGIKLGEDTAQRLAQTHTKWN